MVVVGLLGFTSLTPTIIISISRGRIITVHIAVGIIAVSYTHLVPQDCKVGDKLNVFIYLDNEERLVATTLTPLVQVGQFACLAVAWINQYGAFLNWGLMKDLFVPFREQKMKMQEMCIRDRNEIYFNA